jgi:ABC-2 type transport system permease protein
VDATIDIDPAHRSFTGKGRFTLQNKTSAPIPQIHITDARQSVSHLSFDRPFHLVSQSARNAYSIYQLDTPLAPGEVLTMSFDLSHQSQGFRDGNELAQFAYNGTFFDREFFPDIGYSSDAEIDDPRRRREEGLGLLQDMAPRGDPCTRA